MVAAADSGTALVVPSAAVAFAAVPAVDAMTAAVAAALQQSFAVTKQAGATPGAGPEDPAAGALAWTPATATVTFGDALWRTGQPSTRANGLVARSKNSVIQIKLLRCDRMVRCGEWPAEARPFSVFAFPLACCHTCYASGS